MDGTPIRLRPIEELARLTGHCERCGKVTSAKSGLCRGCMNGYRFPDPRGLSLSDLLAYQTKIREELLRRKAEIDAALEEKTGGTR